MGASTNQAYEQSRVSKSCMQNGFHTALRLFLQQKQSIGSHKSGKIQDMEKEASFRMSALSKDVDAQLILPGAGLYIYWQMGALSYLREHFDLERITMTGASAGAIVGMCAAMDIDPFDWMTTHLKFCEEAAVWDRHMGAIGVLSDIAMRTVDAVVPKDAAQQLAKKKRVTTVLLQPATIQKRKPTKVSNFNSRRSVMDAISATIHIPLISDGTLSTKFRGKAYMDGAIFATDEDFIDPNCLAPVIKLSINDDPFLKGKGALDCVKTISKEEIWDLYWKGRACMEMLEEDGRFDCLTRIDGNNNNSKKKKKKKKEEAPPCFWLNPRIGTWCQ